MISRYISSSGVATAGLHGEFRLIRVDQSYFLNFWETWLHSLGGRNSLQGTGRQTRRTFNMRLKFPAIYRQERNPISTVRFSPLKYALRGISKIKCL